MEQDPPRNEADLAALLLSRGRIDAAQAEQVRRRQSRLDVPQHRAVLDLGFASEEDTCRALAELHHQEFVDLTVTAPDHAALDLVPVKLVFHYHMVPLAVEGEVLTLVFGEPPKPLDLANLKLLLSRRLKIALATPSAIHALLRQRFGLGAETIQKLREDRGPADASGETVFDVKSGEAAASDATVAAFVDQIVGEALRLRATDIHIEPFQSTIRLRYRIDGMMTAVPVPPPLRQVYAAIVSRLKIMAGLNIAEKRLPHDGRIAMKSGDREYDLRVSVVPTKHGEAVCLRVLGRQNLFLDLAQLGMEPPQERLFVELTKLPQGLVLITGPTGSGKTTTLYAALAQASDESRKVLTLEDPVEYQLEGTTQIQVRDDIGLSFSAGLRSILRHDPDVVLVGEVRDNETAEIAVRAAQTGHLVFSTLHTNDSVSAVTRLVDMKIEPFLVASSLVCSVAQRLVRRICRHCIEPEAAIPAGLRTEMAKSLGMAESAVKAFRGRGCVECGGQGSRGRVALYEFFVVDDEMADLIAPGVKTGQLRAAARRAGWRSLRDANWVKIQNGITTLEEQQRMTRQIGLSPA